MASNDGKKNRSPYAQKVTLGDLFSAELKQDKTEEKGGSMPHRFIAEMQDGDLLESTYFCSKKMTSTTKQGKAYLNLTIADKTGEVVVRVFDSAEEQGALFNEGDFVHISGRSQIYQNQMQVIARKITKVDSDTLNPADFMPASQYNPDEMADSLRSLIESVNDEHLKQIGLAVFDDEGLMARVKRAPAAKSMHHSYMGGLLEHTLSMARLADMVCRHYNNLNRDMLLIGILFHDIGKVYELSYEMGIDYTDSGKLIGHITIGAILIEKLAEKIDGFPKEHKRLLQHIVLAHHGTREFGSPVIPATVEANIIHHLDNLDAKINAFLNTAEKSPTDSPWTDKHFLLGTQVRKTVEGSGPLYNFNVNGESEEEDK